MKKFTIELKHKAVNFLQSQRTKKTATVIIEILLIGLWAAWVGRDYLDFNPRIVPTGREFGSAIQTHYLWIRFKKCGWCAVWNGSVNGGYPAFVDIHGSMLHPLVIISTLLFGVVNGAKIVLVLSFWFAGIAQWWIAQKLNLGRIARLWSAGIVVVGGHLTGRMELGAFGVVLSTAMSSLVIVGILSVAISGGKRNAVLLGILSASAVVSGQGYIQIGVLGFFPGMLFLILDNNLQLRPIWKDYALAIVLALMLAAFFLVPFLHFIPNFVKDTDPEFKTAQPLKYLPLNLVIDEWIYYKNEALAKLPFPHLYTLFIGWVPVLLAFFGLSGVKKEHAKIFWFFLVSIIMEFLIGSAAILKPLTKFIPKVGGIRHPSQISGMAIPFILAFAAFGLDRLIKTDWPQSIIRSPSKTLEWKLSLRWLILIPLIINLYNGYHFSQNWISNFRWDENIDQVLSVLKTEDAQWVEAPFGEHFYISRAMAKGLKLSPGIMTWRWADRPIPTARLIALRQGKPEDAQKIGVVDFIPIYMREDEHYAAVYQDSSKQSCEAHTTGGNINVSCDVPFSGDLIVKENTWSGWKAWRDGERVPLKSSRWLRVNAPAGTHNYIFRYLPWDVPLGMAISVTGIVFCLIIWSSSDSDTAKNTFQKE